jgi:hypothetical protein
VLDRLGTGDRVVTACALGGEDRRTLFLTTVGALMPPDDTIAARSGRVEYTRVEVPGAGRP